MSARWLPNTAEQYWVRRGKAERRAIPRGTLVKELAALEAEALAGGDGADVRVWRTGLDAWVSPLSTRLRGRWVKDTPESEGVWECEWDFAARRRADGTWSHAATWSEGEARWSGGVPAGEGDRRRWEALLETGERGVAEVLLNAVTRGEERAGDPTTDKNDKNDEPDNDGGPGQKLEEREVVCVDISHVIAAQGKKVGVLRDRLRGLMEPVRDQIMAAISAYFGLGSSFTLNRLGAGDGRRTRRIDFERAWFARASCSIKIWLGDVDIDRGSRVSELKLTIDRNLRKDVFLRMDSDRAGTRLRVIHRVPVDAGCR